MEPVPEVRSARSDVDDVSWARDVVERATEQFDQVAHELTLLMRREIPALEGQDALADEMLEASVRSNVAAIRATFAAGSPAGGDEAPDAALAYARLLAQRDAPLSALLRAYRLGHSRFISYCIEVADTLGLPQRPSGTIRLVDRCAAYIDEVSEQVGRAYEHERDRWASRRTARRQRLVARLLAGQDLDAHEAGVALGYDLRRTHVAIEAWSPPRARSVADDGAFGALLTALHAAPGVDGRSLLVPVDDRDARIWLPVRDERFEVAKLRDEVARAGLDVRVAVGDPATGPDGFRSSHRQALATRRVAEIAVDEPTVATFSELGPIALLCQDPETVGTWVATVLGGLAAPDDRAAWLRETLFAFLDTGASYAATAERLTVHRNTVQYRVHQALEVRGRPLEDDRYDVHLALRVCRWLGPPVGVHGEGSGSE